MKNYYKINITINDGENELNDEIIVTKTFNGFFYQEIVTNKLFYPLYRYPVSIEECIHNGEYMDGSNEIKKQINENGYSMIMFLENNKEIEKIDDTKIKEYYKNFPITIFSKYIGKDIQKKKIKLK